MPRGSEAKAKRYNIVLNIKHQYFNDIIIIIIIIIILIIKMINKQYNHNQYVLSIYMYYQYIEKRLKKKKEIFFMK